MLPVLLAAAAALAGPGIGGSEPASDRWTDLSSSSIANRRHATAEDLATEIRILGPDHPETIPPMLRLASIHNELGEFAEAEQLYRHCLDLAEHALGPADTSSAKAASGLGLCLANLGDYAGAEKLLRRSLDATTAVHGRQTPQAGDLTLALAEVLAKLGKHAESTQLYREAAEAIEEAYGPDHERYAAALSGLAHTKRRIGNCAEAETLYRQAIEIVERRHGSHHPDLIHYRCRLGMTLSNLNRDEEGLRSIEKGIALAVDLYGADSYQVAIEERHLGLLLNENKRFAESRKVLLKSLETLEKCFGPEHPHLSKCLKGLARACYYLDMPDDALGFITRSVLLYRESEGSDQTELVHLLSMKAGIELYIGDWDSAVKTTSLEAETAQTELQRIYGISSAHEAIQFAWLPNGAAHSLVGAAMANPDVTDSVLAKAFSRVAGTHGQVLDWLADRRRILELEADTTQFACLRNAFTVASQRVADLVVRGPQGDGQNYAKSLAVARRDMDEAEWDLSAAFEHLRREVGSRQSSQEMVTDLLAAALDGGATLIHFIRFDKWLDPESPDDIPWYSNYGAFRLRTSAGDSFDLDFFDLGPAASVDSLVFTYRRSIDGVEPGRRPTAREEAVYRSAAGELFEKIWAPVMPPLEQYAPHADRSNPAPLVFIIPDSWLHLVDFNTLLSPGDNPVIEAWRLHHLSSARDLLRPASADLGGIGLLAVGNPTCVDRETEELAGRSPGDTETALGRCPGAYRLAEPLPAAAQEARTLADLYSSVTHEPTILLLGNEATESAVKQAAPGKRVIHLATHGFYCEEATRERMPFPERIANSLFMSGLYLAPGQAEDDGLLTAYEVTGLDLRNVDWVVLSACGSGLGRLLEHEGLFGLRRAFEIAGARTVIMAMWRIDDDAMRDLMVRIFRHRLEGSSTVDAVRQAQLDRLHDQRRRLNRIHPALWGGIVAEGDWR